MSTTSDFDRTAPPTHRLPPPIPNMRLAPAYQSLAIRACVMLVALALIGASSVAAVIVVPSTATDEADNPAAVGDDTVAPGEPTESTKQDYGPGDIPATAATGTASTTDSQLARVEAIADSLPFDWRAAGATFRVGCAPGRPTCHWGLYIAQQNTIWVGPGAFHSNARLFYIVAHETAHAWQYANDPYSRLDDMQDWRRTGAHGLEAAADCLAQVWGATTTYYWNCPSEARQHMQRVFVSTQ